MQQRDFTPDEYTFRVLGQVILAGAAVAFLLFIANLRPRVQYGAVNASVLGYLAVYGFVVGYGLVQTKRWAALLLSVPLLIFGLIIGAEAVVAGPTGWVVCFALFWAAILSLPSVLTVRGWRVLR